jgi:ABC-type polysaccharide/polyol phosphate export permease
LFGIYLFLTYYVQSTLGYSALKTGLAFLPMIALLMVASTMSSQFLTKRIGPRWIILAGMLLAATGLFVLTQLGVASAYDTHILPGLILVGAGIGLVFSSAPNQATSGLSTQDAGVGSAMVTAMQQLGGSTGASLLNTVAASATATYLASRTSTAEVIVHATVHGYVIAFWWSAAIFVAGAVICGALLTGRAQGAEPPIPVGA